MLTAAADEYAELIGDHCTVDTQRLAIPGNCHETFDLEYRPLSLFCVICVIVYVKTAQINNQSLTF